MLRNILRDQRTTEHFSSLAASATFLIQHSKAVFHTVSGLEQDLEVEDDETKKFKAALECFDELTESQEEYLRWIKLR